MKTPARLYDDDTLKKQIVVIIHSKMNNSSFVDEDVDEFISKLNEIDRLSIGFIPLRNFKQLYKRVCKSPMLYKKWGQLLEVEMSNYTTRNEDIINYAINQSLERANSIANSNRELKQRNERLMESIQKTNMEIEKINTASERFRLLTSARNIFKNRAKKSPKMLIDSQFSSEPIVNSRQAHTSVTKSRSNPVKKGDGTDSRLCHLSTINHKVEKLTNSMINEGNYDDQVHSIFESACIKVLQSNLDDSRKAQTISRLKNLFDDVSK